MSSSTQEQRRQANPRLTSFLEWYTQSIIENIQKVPSVTQAPQTLILNKQEKGKGKEKEREKKKETQKEEPKSDSEEDGMFGLFD